MDKENKEIRRKQKDEPVIRHPRANVILGENVLLIEGRKYEILANVKNGLDLEMLREKYDPFLNQYDYIVGDVSSEHLRLKGFYDSKERVAIDKKADTIVDYLEEYCNPGSPYFVLHLLDDNQVKKVVLGRKNKARNQSRRYSKKQNFKERRVHKTKINTRKGMTVNIKRQGHKNKSFVIKKRKG